MLVAVAVTAAPLGTEFTYQGVLSDGGAPASGDFDFRFLLYDAEVGGSQAGSIVYVEDLTVTDGRMTTELDFGSVFDGTALWLEVGVRDGVSTGAYTVLQPRQELTAAPFAQHAQVADSAETATTATTAATAGHATTAGDADTLDGQHGSYYLTWSNFLGIPGDLANGDDDTLGDLACGNDEIIRWNGTAWTCGGDDDTPYVRTYVVGPVGTPIENGLALQGAIGSIPIPTNQEGAVLLKLEPGVYDLGSQSEALFPWMVIEGAGREVTRITSGYCSMGVYQGTFLSTSDHAGLRHLTLENTCADPARYSIALSNQGDLLSVDHVTLSATGTAQHNHAMYNSGHTLLMTDSTLYAENGSTTNVGLVNMGAGATLVEVTIEVGDGSTTRGVDNDGNSFTFLRGNITTWGGTSECAGIYNRTYAEPLRISDSVIGTSFCPASSKIGVDIQGADAILSNLTVGGTIGVRLDNLSMSFASIQLFDVYASASDVGLWAKDWFGNGCQIIIDDGRYNAGTDAVVNSADTCDVRIGGAYLAGGVNGSAQCAGVYDYSHTFYVNTCPAP
jgi:hypothetical protein